MPENAAFAVIIGPHLNAHLFFFQIGLCLHGHSLGLGAESIFCQHGENESEFFLLSKPALIFSLDLINTLQPLSQGEVGIPPLNWMLSSSR